MHQGLDLSRFKKVSSDKKTTTLRHAKGHEIKIAHSGLTPKMKEKLDSLPVHLAEGGDPTDSTPLDDNSPAQAADASADTPDDSQDAAPAPPDQSPEETPQPQGQAPVTEADDSSPTRLPPRPAAPLPPPQTAAQIAQEMTNHDLGFQQDLAMGKIKPETYQDLFAKKDTLGKIGTMFGLLISGAGSGLAHQSNAVLDMMNKQIQNDFDAQKDTNNNAQNWLRLSQSHQMNQAQIHRMDIENALSQAQIDKNPAEIARLQAESKNLGADTALKASTHAINMAKLAGVQSAQDIVDKLTAGPAKDAAQNGANALNSAVQGDIAQNNLKTGAQIETRRNASTPPPQALDNGVNTQKFNALAALGKSQENLGVAAQFGSPEIAQASKEASDVAENRTIAKIYDDSFKKLDKAAGAGILNPELRAAEMNTLGAEIARATAGKYNQADAAAQADGMFPSAKDWGGSRQEKYKKAMDHFRGNEANTITLDRFGLKTPFPFAAATGSPSKWEGKTIVNDKGQRQTMTNGKWVPVQ
jgi:hypothetical protein